MATVAVEAELRIAVDTQDGAQGIPVLTVRPPDNPSFQLADVVGVQFDDAAGCRKQPFVDQLGNLLTRKALAGRLP